MNKKVGDRKERSDKKVSMKATVSILTKNKIIQFANICDMPIKDVAEFLCNAAIKSEIIIDKLKPYFKNNYCYGSRIIMGDISSMNLGLVRGKSTDRISIKFKKRDYDVIKMLAYALDITPSSTVTVLIITAIRNKEFMDNFIQYQLMISDIHKIRELQLLLNI